MDKEGIFKIKGINFAFRNKYKYYKETETTRKVLNLLKPKIEKYLSKRTTLPQNKEKLKEADNLIHIVITDKKEDGEIRQFGSISRDRGNGEMLLILRMNVENTLENNYEMMKTLIHEIFHLFIEGEDEVRNETEIFISSVNQSTKNKLAELWDVKKEVKKWKKKDQD